MVRVLTVLALLATIAAAVIAGLTYARGTPPSNLTPAGSMATPAAAAQAIQITSPYEEQQVFSLTGKGDVPQGKHLWIFVYAPVAERYFPQGRVDSPNPNPWTVPKVNLGSKDPLNKDDTFTIYALVVDDATNAQIWSFANAHRDEGYSADEWQASYARFVVSSRQVKRT